MNLFKKKPKLNPEDYKYIQMIALRAKWLWQEQMALEYPQEQAAADLETVHTASPLMLKELFEADDKDFHFDMYLILQRDFILLRDFGYYYETLRLR